MIKKKIEVCLKCGHGNILQEVTFMIAPNDPKHDVDWDSAIYKDYYHCKDCNEECNVETVDIDPDNLIEREMHIRPCVRPDCPICG